MVGILLAEKALLKIPYVKRYVLLEYGKVSMKNKLESAIGTFPKYLAIQMFFIS